jgi:hypothetical protein
MWVWSTEAEFKEKHGVWGSYAVADYNLTLTHKVDSEVQLSIPQTNAEECFPSYSKMEQPTGKGRVL